MGNMIHALYRLDNRKLNRNKETICLGQGYKNSKNSGIGIGNCTAGFKNFLAGCPPATDDIIMFLEKNI